MAGLGGVPELDSDTGSEDERGVDGDARERAAAAGPDGHGDARAPLWGPRGSAGGGRSGSPESKRGEARGGAGPSDAEWREGFYEGMAVDCLDSVGKWCDASLGAVSDTHVLVHYTFWSSKWDERIERGSSRLAPYRSKIYHHGGELRAGQRVELWDDHPQRRCWCEGEIVSVDPVRQTVRVHFMGFVSAFDEDLPVGSRRIEPFGTHTKARRYFRPNAASYWKSRERVQRRANATLMEQYREALLRIGLRIEHMDGDGNCLFRTVAHQVYGDQEVHALVRAAAMDYMEAEREWFMPFVAEDTAAFAAYIASRRRDGEHGDDPEVQALCELYNRPAWIYSEDATHGLRLLRKVHAAEDGAARASRQGAPLMLSYVGGGHYDSLVPTSGLNEETLLTSAPGEFERGVLERVRRAREAAAAAAAGAAIAAEDAELMAALERSREQYDANDEYLEDVLLRSMRDHAGGSSGGGGAAGSSAHDAPMADRGATDSAAGGEAGASSSGGGAGGTATDDPESQILASVAEASRRAAEQEALAAAMAVSEQDRLAAELSAAEDAEIALALAQSRAEAGGYAEDDLCEDDPEMQAFLFGGTR